MDMHITFPGGKRVNAEFGNFVVETDQAPRAGGEGAAPEPFTTFLASLGTCAGIYVLGFCQARNIPTEGLELVQHTEYDREARRLSRIQIDIRVPAGFPEKYLEAVKRAADQCAVKKVIFDPPEFVITAIQQDVVMA